MYHSNCMVGLQVCAVGEKLSPFITYKGRDVSVEEAKVTFCVHGGMEVAVGVHGGLCTCVFRLQADKVCPS